MKKDISQHKTADTVLLLEDMEMTAMLFNKPIVYSHEHTTIDLSGVKKDPDCRLDDMDHTIEEYLGLSRHGVRTIVDVTNRGMGRNVEYVQKVAEKTGIRILSSTGYYKEPFLPQEVYRLDEKGIAKILTGEIRDGIGETGVRASAIGEIGTSRDRIEPQEEKIFRAAASAQAETGVPIITHTTLGRLGMEQISLLKSSGADLSHVVLSHIDLSGDTEYMQGLLDTGVNIAFDTVGKKKYQPDESRAEWLRLLCDRGYSSQIVMSMDITRKSHFKANGGPGYSYLLDTFVPMLSKSGISEKDLTAMLCTNPVRIYRLKEE
jgi:phosphotriesterase-related protein